MTAKDVVATFEAILDAEDRLACAHQMWVRSTR
jgi:hypothetical protein